MQIYKDIYKSHLLTLSGTPLLCIKCLSDCTGSVMHKIRSSAKNSWQVIKFLAKSTKTALDWLIDRTMNPKPIARVAINMRPIRLSWGGGNQWVSLITRSLRSSGYLVRFSLDQPVDCILIGDSKVPGSIQGRPSLSTTTSFGLEDIARYVDQHPEVMCIHRINDTDQHRSSNYRDELLAKANKFAHHTVFISEWVRDYHAEKWFDKNKPHTVILNGADPKIFHPFGSAEFVPGGILRLVTHHWSKNWMKGFEVYQEIDQLIANGHLPDTELWVIGRWPDEIRWKVAKTFGPIYGKNLARLLRSCHVYVTASKWEAGGMHFIEGVQCGLPLLYHLDGGGIVELGRRFGIGFRDDVRSAILKMRECYSELRSTILQNTHSGEQMCLEYKRVIQQLIVKKKT